VKAFFGQEVSHGKEHEVFNELLRAHGFDRTGEVERWFAEGLEALQTRLSPKARLAYTVGMEHWTAILGAKMLKEPELRQRFDPSVRELWTWHALEEAEHKAVAVRGLSGSRGWIRSARRGNVDRDSSSSRCRSDRALASPSRRGGRGWTSRLDPRAAPSLRPRRCLSRCAPRVRLLLPTELPPRAGGYASPRRGVASTPLRTRWLTPKNADHLASAFAQQSLRFPWKIDLSNTRPQHQRLRKRSPGRPTQRLQMLWTKPRRVRCGASSGA
jgi:hypothetical protein